MSKERRRGRSRSRSRSWVAVRAAASGMAVAGEAVAVAAVVQKVQQRLCLARVEEAEETVALALVAVRRAVGVKRVQRG
jgi:hypothetical protein